MSSLCNTWHPFPIYNLSPEQIQRQSAPSSSISNYFGHLSPNMTIDIARIVQQYVQDLAEMSVTTFIERHFQDVSVLPPDRHVASLDEILEKALVADREIRRLFAVNPHARQLDDLYAGLIDIFNVPPLLRAIRARSVDAANLYHQYIFPLDNSARKPDLTASTVPDIEAFMGNWEIFTHRVLCKMTPAHWTNVIAAGGSVLASLMAIPSGIPANDLNMSYLRQAWGMSDVDLFLYGLSPEQVLLYARMTSLFLD